MVIFWIMIAVNLLVMIMIHLIEHDTLARGLIEKETMYKFHKSLAKESWIPIWNWMLLSEAIVFSNLLSHDEKDV